MNTILLKTNINCGGCVAKVTPVLENLTGIEKWEVNTSVPEKILEIKTDSLSAQEIISALNHAGFNAEPLPK